MKARIAVIEDDREISNILTKILTENGYEAKTAYDGSSALKMLKNDSFDLILMDLMLPYMNGETLIYELRKISDTPVIVISAKSMMETTLVFMSIIPMFQSRSMEKLGVRPVFIVITSK